MVCPTSVKVQTIDASNIDLHTSGEIESFYIRPFHADKGEKEPGHLHQIDHVLNLVRGSARITWTDRQGELGVINMLLPCKVHIDRERWHEVEALEDGTLWECWFSRAEAEALLERGDLIVKSQKQVNEFAGGRNA